MVAWILSRLLVYTAVLLTLAAVPVCVYSDSDEPSSTLIEKAAEDSEDDDDRESLVALVVESTVEGIVHTATVRQLSTCMAVPFVRGVHHGRGPPAGQL